jgi:hypothetical protein
VGSNPTPSAIQSEDFSLRVIFRQYCYFCSPFGASLARASPQLSLDFAELPEICVKFLWRNDEECRFESSQRGNDFRATDVIAVDCNDMKSGESQEGL